MITFFTTNLLWSEGWFLVVVSAAVALLGFFFFRPLLFIGLFFYFFCLWFFRNPDRVCPEALRDDHVIVCPADGTVVQIQHDPQGRFDGYQQKVSIYLSPLNVHVNWVPVRGTIEKIVYHKGTFALAFLPKSSDLNERNDIHIRMQSGRTVVVRQIAGTIARTIRWWVKPAQLVEAGQKYGMIKFGSRVDILLPENVTMSVAVGDKVYGGKTVLGRWL